MIGNYTHMSTQPHMISQLGQIPTHLGKEHRAPGVKVRARPKVYILKLYSVTIGLIEEEHT